MHAIQSNSNSEMQGEAGEVHQVGLGLGLLV